jgi:outer membrane protein assembly factor BamB
MQRENRVMKNMLTATGLFAAMILACPHPAAAQVNVMTQHNDNYRDGVNAAETTLTPANVNVNQFGMLFKVAVDDQVFAQPLVMSNVSIAGGVHTVLYVATANNSVYAFDANSGTQYWHVNFGTPMSMSVAKWSCKDVLGSAGIMSTPVITNNSLYVVAQTYENGVSAHSLHALNLSTGADRPGSPATIQAPDFSSYDELQRPGLLSANGNIYFSFASHCDEGSWKGLTMAYNAATLAQIGVFNASPSDNGNGIWESGNGDAADPAGNIYWVTGNGGWDGETNFSETMLKASPDLALEDWHTPSDYASLDTGDVDLTASGPLLLRGTNLLVAGGKDGVLRLVNTSDMGHLGDATAAQNFQATSSHIHSMTFFNSTLYLWGQADYLRAYDFNGSTFDTTPSYQGTLQAIGHPGGSLSISANGASNGILWAATNTQGDGGSGAWHASEPGILYAYNLYTMAQIWSNEQNPTRDDCNFYAKFTDPTIANGRVYLASFGNAQTNSGQVCVYGLLTSGTAPSTGTIFIPNGTYSIASVLDSEAIYDPGSGAIQQEPATYLQNQLWTVTNLGNNVVTLGNVATGEVLEVPGGTNTKSTPLDQAVYQGNAWQQWVVTPLVGGNFELTNLATGQAVDIDGGKNAPNTLIDQYPYDGTPWQQWQFSPVSIPNGTYLITSVNDGQAIDDPGSSKQSGTVMQQYPVNNGANQHWAVANLGNGVITLTNVASGLALDVQGPALGNSTPLDQHANQGNAWQQWVVTPLSGNAFELTSKYSGEAVDVVGGSKAAKAALDQYPYQGRAWQQWQFQAVQ